jgi:hypothetical protein
LSKRVGVKVTGNKGRIKVETPQEDPDALAREFQMQG